MPPSPAPRLTDADLAAIATAVAAQLPSRVSEDTDRKVDEILLNVTKLGEQTRADHELVAKHERTLYGNGNGEEGMNSKVRHLQRVSSTVIWAAGIVAGTLLTAAIGTFIYLATTHPLP